MRCVNLQGTPRLIKSSGAQIVEIETNLFTYSLKLAYLI